MAQYSAYGLRIEADVTPWDAVRTVWRGPEMAAQVVRRAVDTWEVLTPTTHSGVISGNATTPGWKLALKHLRGVTHA